jgi:TonB family protein
VGQYTGGGGQAGPVALIKESGVVYLTYQRTRQATNLFFRSLMVAMLVTACATNPCLVTGPEGAADIAMPEEQHLTGLSSMAFIYPGVSQGSTQGSGDDPYLWLQEEIWAGLKRSLKSPREAWLRDLQGTTIVQATILDTGEIPEVAIVKSSGHAVIDGAAVDGVCALAPLKLAHPLGRPSVTARIPVIYGRRTGVEPAVPRASDKEAVSGTISTPRGR